MTASVPNRHSPMGEVKKGVMNMVNMGSFVVDQNFLQNQTIKGMCYVCWNKVLEDNLLFIVT